MYRTEFWTLWEKARVGCFERTASKHVYYLGWNRSPAQAGCMRQVLGPGALGRPRGMGWRGRWEGGSGWGIRVNLWLIHVNVWQKPLQYWKVIRLQLIKINGKKKVQSYWYSEKSEVLTVLLMTLPFWKNQNLYKSSIWTYLTSSDLVIPWSISDDLFYSTEHLECLQCSDRSAFTVSWIFNLCFS